MEPFDTIHPRTILTTLSLSHDLLDMPAWYTAGAPPGRVLPSKVRPADWESRLKHALYSAYRSVFSSGRWPSHTDLGYERSLQSIKKLLASPAAYRKGRHELLESLSALFLSIGYWKASNVVSVTQETVSDFIDQVPETSHPEAPHISRSAMLHFSTSRRPTTAAEASDLLCAIIKHIDLAYLATHVSDPYTDFLNMHWTTGCFRDYATELHQFALSHNFFEDSASLGLSHDELYMRRIRSELEMLRHLDGGGLAGKIFEAYWANDSPHKGTITAFLDNLEMRAFAKDSLVRHTFATDDLIDDNEYHQGYFE